MSFLDYEFSGYKVHSIRSVLVPVMRSLLETETTISARLRTGFIHIDINLGVTKWSITAITDGPAAVNEANGFIRDELHCAERVGLELHYGLFEARARLTRWTRALVRRPRRGTVRSLWSIGGNRLGLCWHRRGGRGGGR